MRASYCTVCVGARACHLRHRRACFQHDSVIVFVNFTCRVCVRVREVCVHVFVKSCKCVCVCVCV